MESWRRRECSSWPANIPKEFIAITTLGQATGTNNQDSAAKKAQ
jgi:hypothetical protein